MTRELTAPADTLPTEERPAPKLECDPLHERLKQGGAATVAATMTADDLPALERYAATARRVCQGATDAEAARILTRLFSHYPQAKIPEALDDERWGDWLDDFKDVPADILAAACRSWRLSSERWAPSPGQLMAKAKPMLIMRRGYRDRVERVIEAVRAR